MPDYSKTVIYKICCKDVNVTDIYVGHTTNLYNRKDSHKTNCNNPNNRHYFCYVYYYIRENGGWDNWEIVKLYDYPCNSRNEALIEEKKIYVELDAKVNTIKPYETVEELKKRKKIKDKKYKEKNKEKFKELRKIKINCTNCNSLIIKNNIHAHMKTKKCQSFNQTE